MSSSYGPGRYDAEYEDKGLDYPYGYVRWTENRNLEAYLRLLHTGGIQMDRLISHEFDLEKAPDAYKMILDKSDSFCGIVLRYPTDKPLGERVALKSPEATGQQPAVGFVGAGSFAQNSLLPEAKKHAQLVGAATSRGHTARNIADKYQFSYCTSNAEEVLRDDKINTVFIATRHNTHGPYVEKALEAGKNVFVEKPLCMNLGQLEAIRKVQEQQQKHVMVGFNRRFAPLIEKVKSSLAADQPMAINYRINAGKVPASHWVNDPEVGGGRIIGELCHFIDLTRFLSGSPFRTVAAHVMKDANNLWDSLAVSLAFENGSVASISYFSNGAKSLPKEYLEVFCNGRVSIIQDFKKLSVYPGNEKGTSGSQDKGHRAEVKAYLKAVQEGAPTPIPFEEVYDSTMATFAVLDAIRQNRQIDLNTYRQNIQNR